jgi:spermidine/putrescine transport system ATP-binding protein
VAANVISGVVTDASYIGVSTQYLVKTAWGEELMVFEQNLQNSGAKPGDTVNLSWEPAHTFALDAKQDVDAGVGVVEADS